MQTGRSTRGRGRYGRGASTSGRGTRRNTRPRVYQPTATDLAAFRALQERRAAEFKEMASQLSGPEKDELISMFTERNPTLAFILYDMLNGRDPQPPVPPQGVQPPWCRCTNCREMATPIENVCCGLLPRNCISQQASMDIMMLDPGVLGLANVQMNEYLAGNARHDNEARRHTAYRQFVFWRHGYLGPNVRRVVPSCCVERIRSVYPSADGAYTGFIPGRLV